MAYDIPDDARRTKVMKILERLGRRVQYSVFVVEEATAERVAASLRSEIRPQEDDVRVQVICARCVEKAVLLGLARRELGRLGYSVI